MILHIIEQIKQQYSEIEHVDVYNLVNSPNGVNNLSVKEIKIFKNDIAPAWINIIKNEEKHQNNEQVIAFSKLMLTLIQMGHEIDDAIWTFTNKTKKHIFEQNKKSDFEIISEEEFTDISEVFLDENQVFFEFVDLLKSDRVPHLLCKEFNHVLLKNKITQL